MIELIEQGKVPIKIWEPEGFPTEHEALNQLRNVASLPIVGPHVAVMPDVHWGMGATVGSVIPTMGAIIPAAVGVDIGCGMVAMKTDLTADEVEDKAQRIFNQLEETIPVGGPGLKGSWHKEGWWSQPNAIYQVWCQDLEEKWSRILAKHQKINGTTHMQLGTLGTGNHFIEVCYASPSVWGSNEVWIMLHSGSRGVGNRIGTYFITKAREEALRLNRHLPDWDLGWLDKGTALFDDYVEAVGWAQQFAFMNRQLMLEQARRALETVVGRPIRHRGEAVNCHHNYVEFQGERILTRKGAVSARQGELGIIPGSMGAKSFIVRGKGNAESFESCSHGAGRRLSRGRAKREITQAEHEAALKGVVCRTEGTLDEAVKAYKDIDAVMAAQADLVDVVAVLKQRICVKG